MKNARDYFGEGSDWKRAREYFEKVLFFVKPEYAATSEGTLRERAGLIADSAGIPPASKLKKRKIISALKFACSALAGAAVTALISFLL